MSDEILKQLLEEMKAIRSELADVKVSMATKEDVESIHSKLDMIHQQVAANSEQYTDLAGRVSDHHTDIKLIKKAITNQ